MQSTSARKSTSHDDPQLMEKSGGANAKLEGAVVEHHRVVDRQVEYQLAAARGGLVRLTELGEQVGRRRRLLEGDER